MATPRKTIYDFTVKDSAGKDVSLSSFEGKVLLIVNVASKCGYTPQYDGLEKLYKEFKDRGLMILGFPCNQFGAQEPGSDTEIQEFCRLNYGVSFPVLGKVEVNGSGAHPLYVFLKESAPGLLGTEAIKWNFTKFLIGKEGAVLERFAPATEPAGLAKAVAEALN
jgi:glutathione peroxidase